MRDSFPERVKVVLAARVGYRCSRPTCGAPTSGPQAAKGEAVNVGVAAHITAASPGGPRFDPSLTAEERAGESNGIWLCQICAKLVDNDPARYGVRSLRSWKTTAELDAQICIGKAAGLETGSPLSSTEVELLHAAVEDGDIWVLSTTRGTRVHSGDRDFRSDSDPLVEAVYLDALETLGRKGLARQLGSTHYKLTGEGFRVARVLTGESAEGDASESRPYVPRRRRRRSLGEAWSDKPTKPYLIDNISSTGALLQTDRPIKKGEVLELDLALDDGTRVRVTAEVVRVQRPDWGRAGGVGVTFRGFHGMSLEALQEWAGLEWDPSSVDGLPSYGRRQSPVRGAK